jgi:hypothetical protein
MICILIVSVLSLDDWMIKQWESKFDCNKSVLIQLKVRIEINLFNRSKCFNFILSILKSDRTQY